jgi:hypothetical protein
MDGLRYDPRLVVFEFISRLVLRKKQVGTARHGAGALVLSTGENHWFVWVSFKWRFPEMEVIMIKMDDLGVTLF